MKPQAFAGAETTPARTPSLLTRLRRKIWSILTRGSTLSTEETIW